jgi:hypothetical protein
MAGIKSFATNTSGYERRFAYLPPNGVTLPNGGTYTISGILDTIIALGNTEEMLLQYLADVSGGVLTVTYDLDVSNSIPNNSIDGDLKLTLSFLSTLVRTSGIHAFLANQSMGGNKLTNLGAPTAGGDATNKTYVDSADAVMQGEIGALQAEQSSLSSELAWKLDKRGDTMLGQLLLSLYPSLFNEAATKQYVDDAAASAVANLGSTPLTTLDKEKYVAAPTAGDNSNTGLTISETPNANGNVQVFVNGLRADLGSADLTKDCYFMDPTLTTVRRISDIQAGDVFFWNGVLAGYELTTTFRIDFDYQVHEVPSSSSM